MFLRMDKILIEKSTLTDIGNAIREKENSNDPIPVKEMAKRISTLYDISGTVKTQVILEKSSMGTLSFVDYNGE